MIKFIVLTSLLSLSLIGHCASLIQLAGSYKLTHPDFDGIIVMTINSIGHTSLNEISPKKNLNCTGKSQLAHNILVSKFECRGGLSLEQRIDLNQVQLSRKFHAKVYSSLYDEELEMKFERL